MIRHLKPYPEYKDSGVPWLGEVPAHWEVKPVKRFYEIQLGKMLQPVRKFDDDIFVPYLKAIHVQWSGINTNNLPKMWASQRELSQYSVKPGDLLVCEGGEGGRCAILRRIKGLTIIQNALHRVRPFGQASNEYLFYSMKSISDIGWFDALNDKATIAHFTREKFAALEIVLPPLPEQTAIVRFLDRADRRIRRAIRTRQKRIKLLEEYKQAVINQAVTGKIDVRTCLRRGFGRQAGKPYSKYKDTGVQWLGEVPEHWEVRRLKYVARLRSGESITSEHIEETGDYAVYGGNGIRGFTSSFTHEGEFVLIGRQGALCGNINYARGRFWASEHAVVAQPLQKLSLHWFGELLRTMNLNQYSIAAAQPGLAVERIQNLAIPLPPIDEQEHIDEYIKKRVNAFDAAIAATRRAIDLLKAFRTRLVADVVTGKLDVRSVKCEG